MSSVAREGSSLRNRLQRNDETDSNVIEDDVTAAAPAPPKPFSFATMIQELFRSYKEALRTAPIYTKSITSATIAILGEIFGSYLTCQARKEPFSLKFSRLRAFGLYGLLITGPLLHWWYALLESTLQRLNYVGYTKTLVKLLIDRILFAPPMVLLTVTFLQYLQHFSVEKTIKYVKESYGSVFWMNEKVWTIAQAVNFELVPVEYQVLFVNTVAIGWNTMLSLAS